MILLPDGPELRQTIAQACRVLAARGLVEGILGHVSARVSETEMLIRCRGPNDPGLSGTRAQDVWRVTLDGTGVDLPDDYSVPKEHPLHGVLLRSRPDLGAVVHAHPRSALLCGLAGLEPQAVFGAYNMPAARLALDGVPVYGRPVLISRPELAAEMVEAMAGRDVCLLKGHGVTVGGASVEEATVRTADLDVLLNVTVQLAQLGAHPAPLSETDLADLPDLGSAFHGGRVWRAMVAELP